MGAVSRVLAPGSGETKVAHSAEMSGTFSDRWALRRHVILGRFLALLYRLLASTWRVKRVNVDLFESTLAEGPAVIAIWHGDQMPLLGVHASKQIAGLASKSRDGEILAALIQQLGYQVFRGSSSRGSMSALRGGFRLIGEGVSPALAVDGPRGPSGNPQPGAVALAQKMCCPVLYMACHTQPSLRLNSWDRFKIPLPGARLTIAYGLFDPSGLPRDKATEALGVQMHALSDGLSRPSEARLSDG